MTWITENPWPLMLILGGVAVVLAIAGDNRLRTAALCSALLAAAVYFVEGMIVTPGERVEDTIQAMLEGFIADDAAAINKLIAEESPGLKDQAREGLDLVTLHSSFHLKDLAVRLSDDQQTADVELRANGTLTLRNNSSLSFVSTRWRTKWVLRDDVWKLLEVHRLNPVSGEEIGVLSAQ